MPLSPKSSKPLIKKMYSPKTTIEFKRKESGTIPNSLINSRLNNIAKTNLPDPKIRSRSTSYKPRDI